MTGSAGPDEPKQEINEYELAWAAENLPEIRRWISGRLFLYKALVTALALGLAAHTSGYLLAASVVGEPAGLIADLLRNVGIALWTGGVLVFFVQLLPDMQRQSAVRMLQRYEAALHDKGRLAGPDPDS